MARRAGRAAARAHPQPPALPVDLIVRDVREGAAPAPGSIQIGLHRDGPLPAGDLESFDILLSADPSAPAPWVGVEDVDGALAELAAAFEANPLAAAVLTQVLRLSLALPFEAALAAESLAYSMLLAGEEFRSWRVAHPPRLRPPPPEARVRLAREGEALAIWLARPGARNAVDARMRDDLVEALEFALIDPGAPPVVLRGEGPAFCAGGDLDEFGTARDPSAAHAIRMARSAARLVHRLGSRVGVRLHGACIGAGIEIPAAAGRVVAAPDAYFQLPEVGMGLIPGAGGAATIPRRIGRHRTAWLALSGARLDAATALAWGLIDTLEAEA
jgi:enoyl-CoA hydratase/carnithine racemase